MSEYKALYRKWRPVDFDDVCGQKSITDILKYEVSSGKVSHAYLFCGSRGTGKTSCAKILAKAVNCTESKDGNPCNRCEACRSIDMGIATDVIEMDAASNNGIDDVRNLKDEIAFTPALLKYRVYIIDEVHMMSGAAFNALLKTLEEPPSYVVFILATTEYNKLPTTIVSRCQRFDFRRMTSEVIIERLMKISAAEGISLTEDGARLIARASRGGMRDAVSLLELCRSSGAVVDSALVSETIGAGDRTAVYRLIEGLGRSDYDTVYTVIRDAVMGSTDISVFWQELIDSYRDLMVVKNSISAKTYLDLTDLEYNRLRELSELFGMSTLIYHTSLLEGALADMQRASNAKRSIAEITLTRMCDARLVITPEALLARIDELEKKVRMMSLGVVDSRAGASASNQKPPVNDIKPKAPTKDNIVASDTPRAVPTASASVYSAWNTVVERITELKAPLGASLKGSQLLTDGAGHFILRLNDLLASIISSNESSMSLLVGMIAENEGVFKNEITLKIEPVKTSGGSSPADELDEKIK